MDGETWSSQSHFINPKLISFLIAVKKMWSASEVQMNSCRSKNQTGDCSDGRRLTAITLNVFKQQQKLCRWSSSGFFNISGSNERQSQSVSDESVGFKHGGSSALKPDKWGSDPNVTASEEGREELNLQCSGVLLGPRPPHMKVMSDLTLWQSDVTGLCHRRTVESQWGTQLYDVQANCSSIEWAELVSFVLILEFI